MSCFVPHHTQAARVWKGFFLLLLLAFHTYTHTVEFGRCTMMDNGKREEGVGSETCYSASKRARRSWSLQLGVSEIQSMEGNGAAARCTIIHYGGGGCGCKAFDVRGQNRWCMSQFLHTGCCLLHLEVALNDTYADEMAGRDQNPSQSQAPRLNRHPATPGKQHIRIPMLGRQNMGILFSTSFSFASSRCSPTTIVGVLAIVAGPRQARSNPATTIRGFTSKPRLLRE